MVRLGEPFFTCSECAEVSDWLNVCRLLTLRALIHVKADLLVFLQQFEAFCMNLGEVRQRVLATIIRRDETKTLRIAAEQSTLTVVRAHFQSAAERS